MILLAHHSDADDCQASSAEINMALSYCLGLDVQDYSRKQCQATKHFRQILLATSV